MKIPDKIKLGAHNITIQKVPMSEIENGGLFDSLNYNIRLRNDINEPESKRSECFLHEIIESIRYIHNMEINHKEVTTLSECLFQVIRDNNLIFSEIEE